MSGDKPIQNFLEQTFSTTEAAAILDLPAETFRTQLKQRWLPVSDDRAPGQWRRLNPNDLLRCRVTIALSARGIQFPIARRIVGTNDLGLFDEAVFLYVTLNPDGSIHSHNKCGVVDLGIELANAQQPHSAVVNLASEKAWVIQQIDRFWKQEAGGRPDAPEATP
ncbi:MAG: hypothetical protein HY822_02025 [Acidobacteria bacterium]|nr:hypothetical protein [Acidobacteriota bacterium]